MVGLILGTALFWIVVAGLMFYMIAYFPYKHALFYYTHDPFKKSIVRLTFISLFSVNFLKVLVDYEEGTPFSWSSYITIFLFMIMSIDFIPMFLSEYNYQKTFRSILANLQEMYPDENLSVLEKRVEEMLKNKHAGVSNNDNVSAKQS